MIKCITENYNSVLDKGDDTCIHKFVFQDFGLDVGIDENGNPFTEDQKIYKCKNCSALYIECDLKTSIKSESR